MSDHDHTGDGGDPIELGQNPSLEEPFESISSAHEQAREDMESAIGGFARGEEYTPVSIRGPFRTGKTALQYHGFKFAWSESIPAVYVEASTLLKEFGQSEETAFDAWVQRRMQEEVTAMAERDFDSVNWFPAVANSTDERRTWVESNVPRDVGSTRGVLFVDEVEQVYTEFISATGVDDDNPLRKLLDHPQMLTILSMGQLSAFEFIGDADLGRMEPVSIPPITVEHIEHLLDSRNADPALGRVGYWLTRGRAARVHQLVTEVEKQSLSPDDHELVADWLSSYARQQSSEFQPIRQIWEDPIIDTPQEAAGALAFDPNGYDDWIAKSENWYPASGVINTIETVLLDTEPFAGADSEASDVREGRRILRQSISWVVRAMAAPPEAVRADQHDRAIPVTWLSGLQDDREESTALLNLVQDLLLAFEADRDARDCAFDALENAKGTFKRQYEAEIVTLTAIEGDVWTVRPTVLERAFPPLATDPSRLTNSETSALKREMNCGLEVTVDEPATMYACPTQETFESQLEQLDPDLTHPTVILVDEAVDIDEGLAAVPVAAPLASHGALNVVTVQTTRVWEFVTQLFGRLRESDDPYSATEQRVAELAETVSKREDRTTIETLYDHLSARIAAEAAQTTVESHRQQFEATSSPLWAEPGLAGSTWINPRASFHRERHAVASLLALGAAPNWDEDHGELLQSINAGFNDDSITTRGKFGYIELLKHINKSGGYGESVKRPRRVCRNEDDTAPTDVVTRVQAAFESILEASDYDTEAVLRGLFEVEGRPSADDPQTDAAQDLLESFDPIDDEDITEDVLWALFTATLARKNESYVVKRLEAVEADLTDLVEALKTYEQGIDAAEDVLAPEGVPTGGEAITSKLEKVVREVESHAQTHSGANRPEVDDSSYGTGVTLHASTIESYRENLEAVRDGIRDAKDQASANMDFRPTAYAFAVLGSRYEYVIRDAVDELDHATPTDGDLSDVKNLRSEVQQLTGIDAKPALSEFSDDRVAAIKSHADELLDLQGIINGARITVGNPEGDGMDTIRHLNRAAAERSRQVEGLIDELGELSNLRAEVADKQRTTRMDLRGLTSLLVDPQESIEPGLAVDVQTPAASDEFVNGSQQTDRPMNTDGSTTDPEEANDD